MVERYLAISYDGDDLMSPEVNENLLGSNFSICWVQLFHLLGPTFPFVGSNFSICWVQLFRKGIITHGMISYKIWGNFMVYHSYRILQYLFQKKTLRTFYLFKQNHPESLEWSSLTTLIIFKAPSSLATLIAPPISQGFCPLNCGAAQSCDCTLPLRSVSNELLKEMVVRTTCKTRCNMEHTAPYETPAITKHMQ